MPRCCCDMKLVTGFEMGSRTVRSHKLKWVKSIEQPFLLEPVIKILATVEGITNGLLVPWLIRFKNNQDCKCASPHLPCMAKWSTTSPKYLRNEHFSIMRTIMINYSWTIFFLFIWEWWSLVLAYLFISIFFVSKPYRVLYLISLIFK